MVRRTGLDDRRNAQSRIQYHQKMPMRVSQHDVPPVFVPCEARFGTPTAASSQSYISGQPKAIERKLTKGDIAAFTPSHAGA